MPLYYTTFPTPAGRFSLAVDEAGVITATAFGGKSALAARADGGPLVRDDRRTRRARTRVRAYFARGLPKVDLPVAKSGTAFQGRVWAALRKIPFGQTRTYGEIAAAIGSPKAVRAVGGACGANPVCLIIPCHRVIGANGSLTGFAFGEATKRRLLKHEGSLI
jgi:methylated-DNA-[protein]-cysteine S-methyltransferase